MGLEQYVPHITTAWLFLTFIALALASIILAVRSPHSRMERASFFLVCSYLLIIGRTVWTLLHSRTPLPSPVSAVFWLIQVLVAMYFLYALVREWWPVLRGDE